MKHLFVKVQKVGQLSQMTFAIGFTHVVFACRSSNGYGLQFIFLCLCGLKKASVGILSSELCFSLINQC